MTSTRERIARPEVRRVTSKPQRRDRPMPIRAPERSVGSPGLAGRDPDPTFSDGLSADESGGSGVRAVVALRRRREVGVNVGLDELPIAVGFGALPEVRPSRLRAVPAHPLDVPAPESIGSVRTHDLVVPGALAVPGLRELRPPCSPGSSVLLTAVEGQYGVPVRSPDPAPLRLTARGRAVLLIVAGAIGLAVVVSAWFGAGASAAPTPAAPPAQVVVHSGDTLWTIAGRIAPNRDPRAVIDQLLRINHLDTPALVPGQILHTH